MGAFPLLWQRALLLTTCFHSLPCPTQHTQQILVARHGASTPLGDRRRLARIPSTPRHRPLASSPQAALHLATHHVVVHRHHQQQQEQAGRSQALCRHVLDAYRGLHGHDIEPERHGPRFAACAGHDLHEQYVLVGLRFIMCIILRSFLSAGGV